MMKKTIFALMISIIVLTFLSFNKLEASEKVNPYGSSLMQALKQGGYLIYFRHGETIGQDLPHVDFNDCTTQKKLTLAGKEQARWIGELFSLYKIPLVSPVSVSSYCRTRETAEIAFGKPNVEVVPFLSNIEYLRSANVTESEEQDIIRKLNELFEKPIPSGINKIIIGHTFSPNKVLGEITYMGMVIIKPNGVGKGYEVFDKISFEELTKYFMFPKKLEN